MQRDEALTVIVRAARMAHVKAPIQTAQDLLQEFMRDPFYQVEGEEVPDELVHLIAREVLV